MVVRISELYLALDVLRQHSRSAILDALEDFFRVARFLALSAHL